MRRLRWTLARDRRGSATIEFALLSLFFLGVMLVALDFGFYFIQRSNLNSAVQSAAVRAFIDRDSVNFANLPTFVSQAANAPAGTTVAVTLTCNGLPAACTNNARVCACLNKTGGFVPALSCGAPCTGANMTSGSISGYYLRINASYTFRPLVLPRSATNSLPIEREATVRLQ